MSTASDETGRRGHAAALGAPGWPGLAAAPTFAVMALLTYVLGGDADMMCWPAHGASLLAGMVPMYLLMSAFHSAPWLKLIFERRSSHQETKKLASCDFGNWSKPMQANVYTAAADKKRLSMEATKLIAGDQVAGRSGVT